MYELFPVIAVLRSRDYSIIDVGAAILLGFEFLSSVMLMLAHHDDCRTIPYFALDTVRFNVIDRLIGLAVFPVCARDMRYDGCVMPGDKKNHKGCQEGKTGYGIRKWFPMPYPEKPSIELICKHSRFASVQFQIMNVLLVLFMHARINISAHYVIPRCAVRISLRRQKYHNGAAQTRKQQDDADEV